MSFVPAFQLGVCNAWVLILPFVLVGYGLSFSIVSKEAGLRLSPQYNKKEKEIEQIREISDKLFDEYVRLPDKLRRELGETKDEELVRLAKYPY